MLAVLCCSLGVFLDILWQNRCLKPSFQKWAWLELQWKEAEPAAYSFTSPSTSSQWMYSPAWRTIWITFLLCCVLVLDRKRRSVHGCSLLCGHINAYACKTAECRKRRLLLRNNTILIFWDLEVCLGFNAMLKPWVFCPVISTSVVLENTG